MYGLIRVYVDSDTACSSKEQWKCKYGLWKSVPLKLEKCKNLRNTPKLRFKRKGDHQRVSQAKKSTIATLRRI